MLLIAGAMACGSGSGGAGGAPSASPFSETVQDADGGAPLSPYCRDARARAASCGTPWAPQDVADCMQDAACCDRILAVDVKADVARCAAPQVCARSNALSQCVHGVADSRREESAVVAYNKACLAKVDECAGQNDRAIPYWRESLCTSRVPAFAPEIVDQLTRCFAQDCRFAYTCAINVYKAVGCNYDY